MSEENDYTPSPEGTPRDKENPQDIPPQDPGAGQPYPPPQNPYAQGQNPYTPPQTPYGAPGQPYAPPPQDPYAQGQNPYGPPQTPYGAPNQPYGQQPAYGQMDPGFAPNYGGGPEQPPQKSILPKVLIGVGAAVVVGVVALVLLLGKGGGSGNINGVSRKSPQEYLAESRQITGENLSGEGKTAEEKPLERALFPNVSRFGAGPKQLDLSLEVLSLYDEPELTGAYADLTLKADVETGNALFELGVGYAGISVKNNQLFIGDDFVALSIPDLYSRHKYVSIRPSTFVDDWNASPLGAMSPLDLSGMLDMQNPAFMEEIERFGEAGEKLRADWSTHFNNFYNTATFKDEGTETITIRGKAVQAAALSYQFDAAQADAFYAGMLTITEDFMAAYIDYMMSIGSAMESMYYYNPYEDMLDEMAEAFREAGKLRFPTGLKLTFYVNEETGFINRLSLDKTRLGHAEYPGDEYDLSFTIDMVGTGRLTDDFEAVFIVKDSYEEFKLVCSNVASRESTVTDKFNLYAEVDGEKQFELLFDMSWDTSKATDNYKMRLDATDDYGDTIFLTLTGDLVDGTDAFALTNGVLAGGSDNYEAFSLGIGFGIKAISASEVEIDRSQAVDFFSLDFDQLTQDIMAGAMGLYAGMY